MQVLELYCGIGGLAAALPPGAQVTAALDINTVALDVYRRNFAHAATACAIESLRADDRRVRGADLWWMSPPCQPYTRRGRGRDVDDPRSRSFLHVLELLARVRPPMVALENVPQLAGSRAHARLREVLAEGGYEVTEREICPTELGVPNRRRRLYVVGSRVGWKERNGEDGRGQAPPLHPEPLSSFVDARDDDALLVDGELLDRYRHAIDVVDAEDPRAVAATFTSAYGRSPVRAGSYLRRGAMVRRFSPAEVARLLGFPGGFTLPPGLAPGSAWRLLGNSLSVSAVRAALAPLPGMA